MKEITVCVSDKTYEAIVAAWEKYLSDDFCPFDDADQRAQWFELQRNTSLEDFLAVEIAVLFDGGAWR